MFIERYRQFLKKEGVIHLRTDSDFMYDYTLNQIVENKYELVNKCENVYDPSKIPLGMEAFYQDLRIKTHYEELFLKQGHTIKHVSFKI